MKYNAPLDSTLFLLKDVLGLAHVKICMATKDKTRHDNALYFVERILPETRFLLARIKEGSDTMMNAEL